MADNNLVSMNEKTKKLGFSIVKFQKMIVIITLIMAAITFIYALGFSTDLYLLRKHSNIKDAMLYVSGSEIYANAQPFNHQLLILTLVSIALSILLFATFTGSRRRYYVGNYITSMAYSVFNIIVSIYMFKNISSLIVQFDKIDFESWARIAKMLKQDCLTKDDKTIFYIGYIIAALLIVISLLVLINLIIKSIDMIKENSQINRQEAQSNEN